MRLNFFTKVYKRLTSFTEELSRWRNIESTACFLLIMYTQVYNKLRLWYFRYNRKLNVQPGQLLKEAVIVKEMIAT